MGLPTEAEIPKTWDTIVPIINGTRTNAIRSSLPQHGPGELVSIPGCCTSTYYFTDIPPMLPYHDRDFSIATKLISSQKKKKKKDPQELGCHKESLSFTLKMKVYR